MIYLASEFIGYKIFSIATLSNIGTVNGIIVDPFRFSVAGFWVEENKKNSTHWPILLSRSIRQINENKILVNDISDLNDPRDLPKLVKILEVDYQLPGKKIISTNKEYLGQAEDFSFDEDNFKIIHISSKPPLYQRLTFARQHFTRSQIEKVSKKSIEVNIDPQANKLQSATTPLN